jgi:hypothetical protein
MEVIVISFNYFVTLLVVVIYKKAPDPKIEGLERLVFFSNGASQL